MWGGDGQRLGAGRLPLRPELLTGVLLTLSSTQNRNLLPEEEWGARCAILAIRQLAVNAGWLVWKGRL